MNATRIGVIARLELTQRLRSVGWYVLLGVFAVLLLIVTVVSFYSASFSNDAPGALVYSIVVNMVLLLVVLISPTLSGNAINGERDAATLAPLQVTLASTGDIMLGKLLAAVATGAAFLAVAVPFLLVAVISGGVSFGTLLVSLLILAIEIVVVAAIGVGLSGLLARPLFSVATTYLVVAGLVIGTLITFGLGGTAVRTEATGYNRAYDAQGMPICDDGAWEEYTYEQPRFDYVWWVLAANPFVVLADATPSQFDESGSPRDVFTTIKSGVRYAQLTPNPQQWDECEPTAYVSESAEDVVNRTVPSWFVGLGVQVLLAGAVFAGAWNRTRTPATKLPPGTRIA